jgi:hypothetical protein
MEYVKRGGFDRNVWGCVILQQESCSMGCSQGLYDEKHVQRRKIFRPRPLVMEYVKRGGFELDVFGCVILQWRRLHMGHIQGLWDGRNVLRSNFLQSRPVPLGRKASDGRNIYLWDVLEYVMSNPRRARSFRHTTRTFLLPLCIILFVISRVCFLSLLFSQFVVTINVRVLSSLHLWNFAGVGLGSFLLVECVLVTDLLEERSDAFVRGRLLSLKLYELCQKLVLDLFKVSSMMSLPDTSYVLVR